MLLKYRKVSVGEKVYYELLKKSNHKETIIGQDQNSPKASSSSIKKSDSNQEFSPSVTLNNFKNNVLDKSMQFFGKIFKDSPPSTPSLKTPSSSIQESSDPSPQTYQKDLKTQDPDLLYDYDLQMAMALSLSMENPETKVDDTKTPQ